ncbi:MAG: SufD family Fe-S cluster assembly protein [Erysipelotrichales bacterium]|nr:SufD family Fe-S cluster assembly protein [Erysipelotrichales bacterium]
MDNFDLKCPHFLIIKNQECLNSSLPNGVIYQNQCLIFQNKEPIDMHVVYIMQQNIHFSIEYIFEKHVEVSLIETKMFQDHVVFTRTMQLKDNTSVHMFSEDNSFSEAECHVKDIVHLQRDASIQCGYGELAHVSVNAEYLYYLEGENASAKVRMAALSQDKEKKYYKVAIEHHCPHTYGQMDNYGVVKESGRLVIDGIGTITKGQYGSASHQTNKIMVFDETAIASANPYLYIDDYDVKASHAAAVGKMDEEHLYYLQSRGLTKKQAMQLITYGYLKPVIEVVDNDMLKEHFESVLSKVGA